MGSTMESLLQKLFLQKQENIFTKFVAKKKLTLGKKGLNKCIS